MKIGIYDSGLGGLLLAKTIQHKLPQYDYIYLGDTQRVPYGNRTPETVYRYATECVDFLFKKGCQLIIVACNTVSVESLRRLQHEYLPTHFPNRRILGVVVPTIEAVTESGAQRVGIIGTRVTIQSNVYKIELQKRNHSLSVVQQATPLLVPFVEEGETKLVQPLLQSYLAPFKKQKLDALILGCTHYCLLAQEIQRIVGKHTNVIRQDTIVPKKLALYLHRHPEIEKKLSSKGTIQLLVTEQSSVYNTLAKQWFGKAAKLKLVTL